ncbi:hypothetical protein [Burkholderia territorii]|uniref:hypothetical protein n=1 Tax=Burkholderia territorii TaxID=1503055 RepID=UPI0012D950AA|nr:hypothetical protein [Burkholderia territorii]
MMHYRKLSIALLLTLLAGCSAVGTRYPSPREGEPSANLKVIGGPVYLITTNEKGCYRGKTLIDSAPGSPPVKVKPDTRLVLSYEGSCLMTFGFVPRNDASYRIVTAEGAAPGSPNASFWKSLAEVNMRQCVVALDDISAGEDALQPIKPTKLHPKQTGFTCIKF